jgi:hypothetical protein
LVKLAMPAEKEQMGLLAFEQRLQGAKAAIVGHGQRHQPLDNPGVECGQHLRLLILHIKPPLDRVQVIGQASKEQHPQRPTFQRRQAWRHRRVGAAEGKAGSPRQKAIGGVIERLPGQPLDGGIAAADDQGQWLRAGGLARLR